MKEIILNSKTGFIIKDETKPVIIRDFRGLSFYNTEPVLPKIKTFNLPMGKYFLDSGTIIRLTNPIRYKLFKLPMFERFRPVPRNFKILFAHNPNKCTIDWSKQKIVFDTSLKEYTLPELDFIRYHEFAHSRYKTEKFCDLLAVNFMLMKGYNLSQIGKAQITSLSDRADDRKIFLINQIKEYGRKQ